MNESELLQYLKENKNSIHPIEGIWKRSYNTIGIIRSEEDKNQFNVFMLMVDFSKRPSSIKNDGGLNQKIFGEPTHGAFDCSNVNIVDFPNGKYVLWLTMTVSNRYPEYRIDDIGIQPDYFIDDNIPAQDWVEYVQSVVEAE